MLIIKALENALTDMITEGSGGTDIINSLLYEVSAEDWDKISKKYGIENE